MLRAILVFAMSLALVFGGNAHPAGAMNISEAGMAMDMPSGDPAEKPCPACGATDDGAISCLQMCASSAATAIHADPAELTVPVSGAVALPKAVTAPVGSGRAPEPPPPRLPA